MTLIQSVLANPWPLGIALLFVGAVIAGFGLREGRTSRIHVGAITLGAGLLVIGVGTAVVTVSEHGERTTKGLIEAVVASDLVAARGFLADDCTLHFGTSRNVGLDLDAILVGLDAFDQRYTVETNAITRLSGTREDADTALVETACWTDAGYGPSVTAWEIRVRRQADGTWKIDRLTWLTLNGEPPPRGW